MKKIQNKTFSSKIKKVIGTPFSLNEGIDRKMDFVCLW